MTTVTMTETEARARFHCPSWCVEPITDHEENAEEGTSGHRGAVHSIGAFDVSLYWGTEISDGSTVPGCEAGIWMREVRTRAGSGDDMTPETALRLAGTLTRLADMATPTTMFTEQEYSEGIRDAFQRGLEQGRIEAGARRFHADITDPNGTMPADPMAVRGLRAVVESSGFAVEGLRDGMTRADVSRITREIADKLVGHSKAATA